VLFEIGRAAIRHYRKYQPDYSFTISVPDCSSRPHLLMTEELAAVHRRSVGSVVESAESRRYAIIAAIDLCFTGV
jgi:hypothetical protein